MMRTFTAGVCMLMLAWLLQRMFELMPGHQGWIVFSAMAAMAFALGQRTPRADGGPR